MNDSLLELKKRNGLHRIKDIEHFVLAQEMEMWEDEYRQMHCAGKTEKELEAAGWWRDNFDQWYCMRLGEEREKKFRKKLYELLSVKIGLTRPALVHSQELEPQQSR